MNFSVLRETHDMPFSPAGTACVDRILNPAREYGFPAGYLAHIESFK